jgi:hypothetical protein
MGIFDKVEKDAEDLERNDPKLAQQAGQLDSGQPGQDMWTAQNMIGKQRGAQDQDQDQRQAGNEQATDPGMASGDPDLDPNADPGQGQD